MTVTTRSQFGRMLIPAISSIIGQSYADYPEMYKEIMDVRSSSGETEELLVMSGLGLFRPVAEGGHFDADRMQQLYSIVFRHAKYGKILAVTQEMIDDGKAVGLIEKQAKELKRNYIETKNKICFDILNNGQTGTGPDGVALLSASHVTSNGNLSNLAATPSALSELALEQCVTELRNMRNDRGIRITVRPKKLVVPAAEWANASRILDSMGRPSSMDNDLNVLKKMNIFPDLVVADHLTDTQDFFIITDVPDGLIMFERKALMIDSEPVFERELLQFKASGRFGVGYGDWRSVFANIVP